jgi:hypothetical protein
MQPTGRWGASPSRISETYPKPTSAKCSFTGTNHFSTCIRAVLLLPSTFMCVPGLNLSQPEKRQVHRWIEMCARLLAPWRIDEPDRSRPHSDARKKTANEFTRQHLTDCRSRMLQQNREAARPYHKQSQAGGLYQVLRPVLRRDRDRTMNPVSVSTVFGRQLLF